MTGLLNSLTALPLALTDKLGKGQTFWLPEQAATMAHDADDAFYLIYWVSLFFFVLIVAWLGAFLWKYRERKGHKERETSDHNTPIEIVWSVIPLIITFFMFWIGFRGYSDQYIVPGDGINVTVTAQKWSWAFTYPNGVTSGVLHAPVGENVLLTMGSQDVIHSLFIPAFRIKKDVVPGRYHKIWFNATKTGTYDLYCTEYCGTEHSSMITKVIIEDRPAYEAWLKEEGEFDSKLAPKAAGERWYINMGCKQCHSLDGSAGTGPTFKDLWGSTIKLADGSSVQADENYVRESILNPAARIHSGFQNVMPSFQGRLEEKSIINIIAFLKSLSSSTSQAELDEISRTPQLPDGDATSGQGS
jgi:cytochrome c oxidase subunit 2